MNLAEFNFNLIYYGKEILIQHWEKEVPFAQKWGVYLEYAKNISKQLLADMLWDVWNWYSNGEMEYEEAQRAAIKKHLKF